LPVVNQFIRIQLYNDSSQISGLEALKAKLNSGLVSWHQSHHVALGFHKSGHINKPQNAAAGGDVIYWIAQGGEGFYQ
jgi:hypothetical protein